MRVVPGSGDGRNLRMDEGMVQSVGWGRRERKRKRERQMRDCFEMKKEKERMNE